nr:AzlC family ABC transporter permease [Falsochrobactrum ovis]
MKTEFFSGTRIMLPLTAAIIPVGMVYGAVAENTGLSTLEVVMMSALVFAGGSQFVAMDIWTHPASWTAVGFAAFLVNLRLVLMSASISCHMNAFSGWRKYVALVFLTDEIWAVSELKARTNKLTPAWFAGAAAPFYATWVISSLIGAFAGYSLGDPAVFALDFAFPAVFIVLMMSFWKGPRTGTVLLASALAASATHFLISGVWYIAAGALAGLVVALYQGTDEEEAPLRTETTCHDA